ncbi:hypothetical protein ACHAW6_004996, partial [Cyclotella cf. meneghiniana]
FLDVILFYPLKTLAYGIPYSTFTEYIQISIEFVMKLCREFGCAIQALFMKEYLQNPDDVDLCNIIQMHCHVHVVNGTLGSLNCSHTIWKNSQRHGQVPIKEKKIAPLLCWRVFPIIMFFGMLLMDMQVPLRKQPFLTCPNFKNSFWMVYLKIKSCCLVSINFPLQVSDLAKCSSSLMGYTQFF